MEPEQAEKLEALGMCWRIRGPFYTWEEWYGEAEGYFRENGHLQVHSQYVTPSGKRLGLWVKAQRYRGRGALEEEQARKLDGIGMEWSIKERSDWEEWYRLAEAYSREHGDLSVPKDYVTEDGRKLGIWVSIQRERYGAARKKPLTREQAERLEELGMSWHPVRERWEKMFSLAKEYSREHGDLMVPQDYRTPEGEKLGRWIGLQRQGFQDQSLAEEARRRLEEIGMVWDPRDAAWEAMYQRAETYAREHGHLKVPQGYKSADGANLGVWISSQRVRYKRQGAQRMPEEQIRRLSALGMLWDPSGQREKEWMYLYAQVKEYWLEHGGYPTKDNVRAPNGKSLRGWYYQQRRDLRKAHGRMSQRRRKLLEEIGIREGEAEKISA